MVQIPLRWQCRSQKEEGRKWYHLRSSLIANPIYVGDMVWNRRTDARFHRISNGQAEPPTSGLWDGEV